LGSAHARSFNNRRKWFGVAPDVADRLAKTTTVPIVQDSLVDTALGELRIQVGGTGQPIMFWPSLLMTGVWRGELGRCLPPKPSVPSNL
jgi:hypothetical protein